MTEPRSKIGIQELVQVSGISRRTIRYYVQLGLLPPPQGRGRGHYYEDEHVTRLQRIRDLRDRGQSLEEVRLALESGDEVETELPEPVSVELVTRVVLGPGLELMISRDLLPPTPSQAHELARAAARILGRHGPEGTNPRRRR